jgi:hypothetical protein
MDAMVEPWHDDSWRSVEGVESGALQRRPSAVFSIVIAGLDPAIHSATGAAAAGVAEWMPWSSHGMTTAGEALKAWRAGCWGVGQAPSSPSSLPGLSRQSIP